MVPVGAPSLAPPNPWGSWQPSLAAPESSRVARARSVGPPSRGSGLADHEKPAHVACLLKEAVEGMLNPTRRRLDGTFDGVYVDCTFGRGGHCREILSRLSPEGRLFAFDVDPEAVAVAKELEREDPRFTILHRPFGDLAEAFPESGSLDGVMVDLGVSSPQLDDWHRGFNINDDLPPDMRMNQQAGITAREWLSSVTAEELSWVIHAYGEDDDALLSERIAEHILARQREKGGFVPSCRFLSNTVKQAKAGCDDTMHPAKLTFQALRVFLNQEMQQLGQLMEATMDRLAMNGKLAIITFKKKEANAVRRFVREREDPDQYLESILSEERLCELYPLLLTQKGFSVEQMGRPIKSSFEEVERNWRSRSSAVHVLRKTPRRSPFLSAQVRPAEARFKEPTLQPAFVGASEPVVADLRPPASAPAPAASAATPQSFAPPPWPQASLHEGRPVGMDGQRCRVYVGNLSYETDSSSLKRLFDERIGGVVRAEILRQQGSFESKGAGIVEFADVALARQAIATMRDTPLDGRMIFVREDREADAPFSAPPRTDTHDPWATLATPAALSTPATGWASYVRITHQEPSAVAPASSAPHVAPQPKVEERPQAEPAPEPAVSAAASESGEPRATEKGKAVQLAARVIADYVLSPPVSGYLSLRKGADATICYEGAAGDEVGWSYGVVDKEHGWFPSSYVKPLRADEAG